MTLKEATDAALNALTEREREVLKQRFADRAWALQALEDARELNALRDLRAAVLALDDVYGGPWPDDKVVTLAREAVRRG